MIPRPILMIGQQVCNVFTHFWAACKLKNAHRSLKTPNIFLTTYELNLHKILVAIKRETKIKGIMLVNDQSVYCEQK